MAKLADFINRVFYENGGTEVTKTQETEETLNLTQAEMASFEASMSEENDEDVTQMAQRIIADSQIEFDTDECPDICKVQSVLDTVGTDAEPEMIRKCLKNFLNCEPDDLEKDGMGRKQAILNAIEKVKQQAAVLKSEKANDEQTLLQAEKDAETSCTEAISKLLSESDQAIEEEKARSAEIIAEIRRNADIATESAKQERNATLEGIAAKRTENEVALKKSANLVAEIERQGQVVIDQVNALLKYLQ